MMLRPSLRSSTKPLLTSTLIDRYQVDLGCPTASRSSVFVAPRVPNDSRRTVKTWVGFGRETGDSHGLVGQNCAACDGHQKQQ